MCHNRSRYVCNAVSFIYKREDCELFFSCCPRESESFVKTFPVFERIAPQSHVASASKAPKGCDLKPLRMRFVDDQRIECSARPLDHAAELNNLCALFGRDSTSSGSQNFFPPKYREELFQPVTVRQCI